MNTTSRDIQSAGGLDAWMRKQAVHAPVSPSRNRVSTCTSMPHAKGRLPQNPLGYVTEGMNKLEARYAGYLEALKRSGRIVFWKFHAFKLRLADKTWYETDFLVMLPDGRLEIHETKGFMRDDANVKIKTAAELFPWFGFVLVQWKDKAWRFKQYRDYGGQMA